MPASVRLVLGQPIDLSAYFDRDGDHEVQNELTLEFLRAIAALADRPDVQPRLIGRSKKPSGSIFPGG
jgi:hypothetical protein